MSIDSSLQQYEVEKQSQRVMFHVGIRERTTFGLYRKSFEIFTFEVEKMAQRTNTLFKPEVICSFIDGIKIRRKVRTSRTNRHDGYEISSTQRDFG